MPAPKKKHVCSTCKHAFTTSSHLACHQLETARIYSHHTTPPDSPPPLMQVTLPATASIPRMRQPSPGSSSSSSSPDTAYPPNDHHLASLKSQGRLIESNHKDLDMFILLLSLSGRLRTRMATHFCHSNSHDTFNVLPIQQNQN